MSQLQSKLLDHVCTQQGVEVNEALYESLDTFLMSNCATDPLLVFSFPYNLMTRTDYNISEMYRSKWNRDAIGEEYQEEEVRTVCNYIARSIFETSEWSRTDIGDSTFFIICFGADEDQRYFGVFRCRHDIEQVAEVMKHIDNFAKHSFDTAQKIAHYMKSDLLIHIDDVTGLYNQRKMLKDLDLSIANFNITGMAFAVLFIDIDHFKNVNDGHGHLIGTQILSDLAEVLGKILRESDAVYRYGGDEFVMIIPDATVENARAIGERILHTVQEHTFSIKGNKQFNITVSIGVAMFPEDAKSSHDVLALADQMMYKAKGAGRGQVCHAGELFD